MRLQVSLTPMKCSLFGLDEYCTLSFLRCGLQIRHALVSAIPEVLSDLYKQTLHFHLFPKKISKTKSTKTIFNKYTIQRKIPTTLLSDVINQLFIDIIFGTILHTSNKICSINSIQKFVSVVFTVFCS